MHAVIILWATWLEVKSLGLSVVQLVYLAVNKNNNLPAPFWLFTDIELNVDVGIKSGGRGEDVAEDSDGDATVVVVDAGFLK